MVRSDSNKPTQEIVSDVQLSKMPLEQRWRYIEDDLINCGLQDKALDSYFSDHYTALYYLLKDSSASAQFCRALYDLSKPILEERDDAFDGYPMYLVLLLAFLSRVEGGNSYDDAVNYMKNNCATLQMLLPGFPYYSKLFNARVFCRTMSVLGEEEVKFMIRGMSKSVFNLLLHTEYKINQFTNQQARETFLENYNLADVMGSLATADVDLKDILRRFNAFLVKDKSKAQASAKTEGVDLVEDAEVEAFNAMADEVEAEGPVELDKEELDELKRSQVEDELDEDQKAGQALDQDVLHGNISMAQALFDMLDLQLKNAGLPTLTDEQRQLVFFHLMFKLAVFTHPVVCENTAELVKAQDESGFDHLYKLDPKMFESIDDFQPEKLFVYNDPRKLFGNCAYDLLNDFVMPLVFEENHPAYNDEFEIRQAVEEAIAKDKPCNKIEYRMPQPDQEEFEQYTLYIFSMETLGLQNLEYHGKIPFQGWPTVMCLRKTIVDKSEVKSSFDATAEQFKEVRTKFFNSHAAVLQAELDEGEELDVVAVMNDYGLDNYSLGVLLAGKGSIPGFVRTQIVDDKRFHNKPEIINGEHVVVPQGKFDSHGSKYYLISKPASFATLIEMLPFSTNKVELLKFLSHTSSDKLRVIRKNYSVRGFKCFDQLCNAFQAQLRILHTKQIGADELLPLRQIKEMFEHDVYYVLDGFVLMSMVFDFLVSHRR